MSKLECGAAHLGEYDLPLHIGAIFIVLATSGIGVGIPLITGWVRGRDGRKASEGDSAAFGAGVGWVRNGFFLARHFGTGIILSTSFIHLLYEGLITFNDPCIGERSYDPAAPAIALAGAYVTFILDFMGGRQRIASVKRQMLAAESKLPLVDMSRALSRSVSRISAAGVPGNVDRARAGGAEGYGDDSKNLPTPVDGVLGSEVDALPARAGLTERRTVSGHDHAQTHAHGQGQDQMVAAMAGGGCGDEHDAVFRAEQGWQVMLLEAGIIFHSIMIGVTLGADSGDSWVTLLIVIVFHQFFEGAALGARIAVLTWISKKRAFLMGLAFTLITPFGIAIGVGVRSFFSHSGAAELISIGVLNSFSAGILLYTAFKLVSQDFTEGPLREAPIWKPVLAMVLMAVGMVAMAVIGKWA